MAEGLQLAAHAKNALGIYYLSNRRWPANNAEAGLEPANQISGNAVQSIEVNNTPAIVITFNDKVAANATLILKPVLSGGTLKWDCKDGTIRTEYRPAQCR